MKQLDLVEMIQYLEKSVMLLFQVSNLITCNGKLNVLSAVKKKQNAKNIKDQVELLEKPNAALFSRVFRDHMKETVKGKKEFK